MYQQYQRAINEKERRLFTSLLKKEPSVTAGNTFKWLGVWSGGFILCLLIAAGLIALKPIPVIGGLVGGVVGVAAIICLYVLASSLILGRIKYCF